MNSHGLPPTNQNQFCKHVVRKKESANEVLPKNVAKQLAVLGKNMPNIVHPINDSIIIVIEMIARRTFQIILHIIEHIFFFFISV